MARNKKGIHGSQTVGAIIVHSDPPCRQIQQILPLKKPSVSTAALDPLHTTVFPTQVFAFPEASSLSSSLFPSSTSTED